jgi:heme O synthase-like polyprenyltransferase
MIKKTLYRTGGAVALTAASAQVALAQAVQVPNPIRGGDLGGVLSGIVNALLIFAAAVAVLFLIIGGFRYVVSTGNPDQVESAKKTILYAILGLIIIFVAYVLVSLLQDWLNVKPDYNLVT